MVGRRHGSDWCQSTPVRARYWLAASGTCSGKTTHRVDSSDNEDNDDIRQTSHISAVAAAAR